MPTFEQAGQQAGAAHRAIDRGAVGIHGLDLRPQVGADERLVRAIGIVRLAPAHLADIDGVAQYVSRRGRVPVSRSRGQGPSCREPVDDALAAPTLSAALEHPAHMRGSRLNRRDGLAGCAALVAIGHGTGVMQAASRDTRLHAHFAAPCARPVFLLGDKPEQDFG